MDQTSKLPIRKGLSLLPMYYCVMILFKLTKLLWLFQNCSYIDSHCLINRQSQMKKNDRKGQIIKIRLSTHEKKFGKVNLLNYRQRCTKNIRSFKRFSQKSSRKLKRPGHFRLLVFNKILASLTKIFKKPGVLILLRYL